MRNIVIFVVSAAYLVVPISEPYAGLSEPHAGHRNNYDRFLDIGIYDGLQQNSVRFIDETYSGPGWDFGAPGFRYEQDHNGLIVRRNREIESFGRRLSMKAISIRPHQQENNSPASSSEVLPLSLGRKELFGQIIELDRPNSRESNISTIFVISQIINEFLDSPTTDPCVYGECPESPSIPPSITNDPKNPIGPCNNKMAECGNPIGVERDPFTTHPRFGIDRLPEFNYQQ